MCLKFDASVWGCEAPIGLGVTGVAVVLPGGDFLDEDLFVGDAAARHWDDRTASSDSARLSQLPCFGV